MSLTSQKILQIQITASSREKILEYIEKYLNTITHRARNPTNKPIKPLVILTPNPEQLVTAQRDAVFRDMLNRADVTLPDGIGIVWAGRVLPVPQKNAHAPRVAERIAGADFMEDLVAFAANRGVSIGLIGGYAGLAVKTFECLSSKYPKLRGWAADGPELTMDGSAVREQPAEQYWDALAEKVVKSRIAFLFVGMGAPKQEAVIQKIHAICVRRGIAVPLVLMAVGGTFAMITGRLRRAPLFIRSIGFEWLWRLVQEPWRWRRQLAIIRFVFLVIGESFRRR